MENSDEALVAAARDGEADAFRVLVERHSRAVYRLTFRMTGNEQDAEDMVQETFLRACRQLKRFDGRASFGTWIHRIAMNCSVDLLRSRKTRDVRRGLREDETDPLDTIAAESPSPERLALSSEVARMVWPALAQLSSQERAAFVLRHYEGRSIDEICQELGLRENAAKHSVFRAVQKLRRALEPVMTAAVRKAI